MTQEEAVKVLKKYDQQHIISFLEQIDIDEKRNLIKQIENIDFELITKLYNKAIKNEKINSDNITPISVIDKEKIAKQEKVEAINIGEQIIKANKLAFVTMAGGQGTRLGHNGPKGSYILDLENNKSLFELLCDSLKKARNEYEVTVPWYIMTSRENNNETIKFFEDNSYFGYGKENVKFFVQGELPMVLEDGKLVMEDMGKIKEAADGHGGIFTAMIKNNIVQDMKEKGIEWVFIGGVDNCLLKMVDPLFIGLCEKHKVKLASKTILKSYPEEKVGVFCKRNGRPSVVEYTEITDEMANLRNEFDELVYGESHILCNMFNIDIIEEMGKSPLEYHSAHKATKYVDVTGEVIESKEPNAYKFESLIFDAFGVAEDILLLRTKREEEFAPVKNKEGVDSPETARKLLNASRQ